MTLHQLRIFAATAKHLSVTKASDELKITQSSVSQQLKHLEGEYAVKLFKKVGRGIGLTERGHLFLSDVELILTRFQKLQRKFRFELASRKPGHLTIGGSHGPSASFLPVLSVLFKETHPQVQLTIRTDTGRAIEQLVLNCEVEIAVLTNPSYSPSLIYKPCRQEELVVFASSKHPVARREELTLEELALAPLVVMKGKAAEEKAGEILRQLEERGFKLNIVLQCESLEAVKTAVRVGVGLGILYRDIVEPDTKGGGLKIIKVPELNMNVDTFITYPKESPLSPNTEDFLAILHKRSLKSPRVKASVPTA